MNEYEKSIKVFRLKELTEQAVKKTYRKLVKKHHPDFFTNPKTKKERQTTLKKSKKHMNILFLILRILYVTIKINKKKKTIKNRQVLKQTDFIVNQKNTNRERQLVNNILKR